MSNTATDLVYFCPPDQATTQMVVGVNGQIPVCKSGGYWTTLPDYSTSSASFWNTEVKGGKEFIEASVVFLAACCLWRMFRGAM